MTFRPDEAKDIPKILELYENKLKSISFLPLTDHSYPQAPYQSITKETFLQASAKMKPLDFGNLNTDEAEDVFCDGDKCTIPVPPQPETEEIHFDAEEGAEVPAN